MNCWPRRTVVVSRVAEGGGDSEELVRAVLPHAVDADSARASYSRSRHLFDSLKLDCTAREIGWCILEFPYQGRQLVETWRRGAGGRESWCGRCSLTPLRPYSKLVRVVLPHAVDADSARAAYSRSRHLFSLNASPIQFE